MTPVQRNANCQSPKKTNEKVTPDSTTQADKLSLDFCKGLDVLAKQKDGRYYFGTLVEVDSVRTQCLVKYGDNTQHWSSFKDLTKLSTGLEQEDLLCVICKKSSPKSDKVIRVCDRCGRGYHKKCHQPEVPCPSQKEDTAWMCKRCVESDPNRLRKTDSKPPFRRDSRNSTGSTTQETIMPSPTTPKVLPFDLTSLNWDAYHRVNRERTYCYYRSTNGEWNSNLSETDSPCPSPEIGKTECRVIPPPPFNGETIHPKDKYLGAGCAKKSAPYKKMSLQRRKKLLAMTNRERERILKRPRRLVTQQTDKKEELSKKEGKIEMPPTPPTSVSAPPTPPASTGAASLHSDFSNEFSENSNQTVKTVPIKKSLLELECNTPCDSSDETSSKSTLDLIIPPPKDFEGKNNPFLALLKGGEEPKKKKNGKDITLPLPLKTVIPGQPLMRPTKRQLSEKDIIVGPNGEIKRRKRLRNLKGSACNNVRRLRQRPEKPPEKEPVSVPSTSKQPTPKPSPVKTEPDIDLEDLKTSVNMYFGAANRIAAGERFTVLARRVAPTGKMECLIEWEGPGGHGMT